MDRLVVQEEVSTEELFPVTKTLTINYTSTHDLVTKVTMTALAGVDYKPALNNYSPSNNLSSNSINAQTKSSSNNIN